MWKVTRYGILWRRAAAMAIGATSVWMPLHMHNVPPTIANRPRQSRCKAQVGVARPRLQAMNGHTVDDFLGRELSRVIGCQHVGCHAESRQASRDFGHMTLGAANIGQVAGRDLQYAERLSHGHRRQASLAAAVRDRSAGGRTCRVHSRLP